jgi:nucleolar GTP-binding protein
VSEKNLPWLQREQEARKLVETVVRLKRVHIYEADEIVKTVGERYRRLRPRKPGKAGRIEFEVKRLETVFNIAYDRLRRAIEMPPLEELSSFHRALVAGYIGEDEYRRARRRVMKGLRLIREFWNQYRWLIATSDDPREAARLRKEASGRILSVVRRLSKDLSLLRRVREELVRTHVIAEGFPVVVVAGIPSSGKSTIVSALSTAEPEVAAYPFTTKTIIVGKVVDKNVVYYLVDTPGVLERPLEMLNEIERKALAALRTLPDVVLFVVDPSPEKVQEVDNQMRLLKSIIETIVRPRQAALIVAINKADITARDSILSAKEKVVNVLKEVPPELLCGEPIVVSAATGAGMEDLRRRLNKCAEKHAPWLNRSNP